MFMSDNLFIICKICNNSYKNAKSFASYIRNEQYPYSKPS